MGGCTGCGPAGSWQVALLQTLASWCARSCVERAPTHVPCLTRAATYLFWLVLQIASDGSRDIKMRLARWAEGSGCYQLLLLAAAHFL